MIGRKAMTILPGSVLKSRRNSWIRIVGAADFLNFQNADVLSVQHEFGIYGGTAGSHLLALLKEVRMPVVTTLHTVLMKPNDAQREVMQELIQRSDRLIVMARKGAEILRRCMGFRRKRWILFRTEFRIRSS